MIKNLSITILSDDAPGRPGLLTEHGFSVWAVADGKCILFDAGQSDRCIRNARSLGIDIRTADMLVLSHGHYDHTGGVPDIIRCNPGIVVYCHSGIFVPRYSRQPDGAFRPIGVSPETANALHGIIDKIQWVSRPSQPAPDIGITGPVPRKTSFEVTDGTFYLDPEGDVQDAIIDDLSVWFVTARGIVLLTGCCHSGIVNTVHYVGQISGHTRVRAIIGGLHLLHASPGRLEETRDTLGSLSLERIVACHCTGEKAATYCGSGLGAVFSTGAVGRTYVFNGV